MNGFQSYLLEYMTLERDDSDELILRVADIGSLAAGPAHGAQKLLIRVEVGQMEVLSHFRTAVITHPVIRLSAYRGLACVCSELAGRSVRVNDARLTCPI